MPPHDTGPRKSGVCAMNATEARVGAVQDQHLARLAEMNKTGLNRIYGPVSVDNDLRGIAILAVPTAEDARKHFADDLVIEALPWMTFKGILK